MPDQTPHGASRGQAWCLPNLEDTFRRPKGLGFWKKQSETLVFEIKRVDEIDKPKTAIKMCSKLTFFLPEVCYNAAINQRAFSHQYTKMRRRMATKEEF